jgi:hypothetical protein
VHKPLSYYIISFLMVMGLYNKRIVRSLLPIIFPPPSMLQSVLVTAALAIGAAAQALTINTP